MLKASKYNHFLKQDNMVIGYNLMYKNLLEMTLEEYEEYKAIIKTDIDITVSPLVPILKENLFLVDVNFDELDYFKYNYMKSLYSSHIFRNTILPTLSCNLACPYCYEFKRTSYISDETIEAYLQWIMPYLQECSEFYISWFGGEPLLGIDAIERITDEVMHLQEKFHFRYSSNMISNGTLMTPDIVHRMEKLHIESVQICFDGDRELHDSYRFYHNQRGTFDEIMQNLEYYCENAPGSAACIIRINVTDANYSSIPSLLDRFSDAVKKRCLVFFHWIYANDATGHKEFSEKMKGKDPFANLQKLYLLAIEKGFYIHTLDEGLNYNFCECDFANGFIIDPDGDIFMCSHGMGKEESVGNVFNGISDMADMARYYRFANASPFNDSQCMKCKFLPICKGGCRKARYMGTKLCAENVSNINKYVFLHYMKHKNRR